MPFAQWYHLYNIRHTHSPLRPLLGRISLQPHYAPQLQLYFSIFMTRILNNAVHLTSQIFLHHRYKVAHDGIIIFCIFIEQDTANIEVMALTSSDLIHRPYLSVFSLLCFVVFIVLYSFKHMKQFFRHFLGSTLNSGRKFAISHKHGELY